MPDRPEAINGPSNRALLDALGSGESPLGHVLVRRDGRVIAAEQARLDDWRDLAAQLDEEPLGPALLRLIEEGERDA